MRFGVLGPVEFRPEGEPVTAGGLKQRSLLAVLLLDANKPVSRDRLIAALWGETPPPSVNAALDAYVYRLRRLLGSERLERRAGGYLLRVGPDELDAGVFERLAAEGRAALAAGDHGGAARQLAEALAQWRGGALADLADQPFAGGEIARLEEARLSVLEDCFDAELAAGRAAGLVPRLEQAVAAHPLRERLVAALMLALYRAGRQADALAAYHRARRRLIDELGLEPGPALRELEGRILRHDPGLSPRPSAPSASPGVPAGAAPLVTPGTPLAVTAGRAPVAAAGTTGRAFTGRSRRLLTGGVAIALVLLLTAGLLLARPGGRTADPVSLGGSNGLVAVDPASGRLLAGLRLDGPLDAVASGVSSLWAADPGSGTVTRRDPLTGAVTDQILVGGEPGRVAEGGGSLWVASSVAATVTRIDPVTEGVTQVITLPAANLTGIAYGDGALWVADSLAGELFEITPGSGTLDRTLSLGLQPSAIVAAAGSIWVAGYNDAAVARIDPASGKVTGRVRVGDGPAALAFAAGSVWVANSLDGTVTAVDPRTLRAGQPISVGNGPTALAADGAAVWVASQYSGTVSRIGTAAQRITSSVAVGGDPTQLTIDGGRLWVSVTSDGSAHRGGTLTIVTPTDMAAPGTPPLSAVDPAFYQGELWPQFSGLAYDTLLQFDETAGANGTLLVPDLARSIPQPADGGTSYTFRIRPGIRYSDGEPLRASDFRRAIERLFLVGSPQISYLTGLAGAAACARHPAGCDLSAGIIADDPAGTVTFRLTAPDPTFLYTLTQNFTAPVPSGAPRRIGTGSAVSSGFLPGTGPYRMVFASDTEVRFARNPYFREWSHAAQPTGYPDAVDWRTVPGQANAVTAVVRGKADWMAGLIPLRVYHRLALTTPRLLHSSPEFAVEFAPLNTNVAPFDNVLARRALNYAIDRNTIARLYGGPAFAAPTCQVITPGLPGYRRYCPYTAHPGAGGAYTGPDLARARQLVRKSGTAGEKVGVWGQTDEGYVPASVPAYVAGVLRSLGYRVTLHLASAASITEPMRERFQLSVDGDWLADYPDPSSYVPGFFACGGATSNGYYCDPALDREMTQAEQAEGSDPAKAAALWTAVDKRITDAAVWVPTVTEREVEVTSPRLGNYQYNPVLGFIADQAWVR